MSSTVVLTSDQEEIRSVARRFLSDQYPSARIRELALTASGFDPGNWATMVELGWPGIAFSEDVGGAGYGTAERCLLLEEMGRVLAPDPFLSSAVLAADAVGALGTRLARELLGAIVSGETIATLVAGGDLGSALEISGAVTATAGPDEALILHGCGGQTLDAESASTLVVVAALPDGSVALGSVAPSAPGVSIEPGNTIDETRRHAHVTFDGAIAARLDGGLDVTAELEDARRRSGVALAAEMIGGAQRCLEMTNAYLKDRKQFGVPIGSFQALKHRMADLYVAVDGAREAVYFAADVIDNAQDEALESAAAMAKSVVSDVYVRMAEETIQLHGGIGFTWEHDAHLYYKRALVTAATLGGASDHLERLAVALGV
jgi:alkylation response protein AidB-like acyl-CoA dehydrogenase